MRNILTHTKVWVDYKSHPIHFTSLSNDVVHMKPFQDIWIPNKNISVRHHAFHVKPGRKFIIDKNEVAELGEN